LNILDRYIFKSVLFTCLAAAAVFVFILMLGNVVRDLLSLVLSGQLGASTFIRLTLLLAPFAVSYALPMGILTGVLLSLGRLSADSEITAMRANGMSLSRIARPVLILGALGAACGLYVNFNSMPWARVEYDKELSEVMHANPRAFLLPKTFIRNFPNKVLYFEKEEQGELKDVWIWDLDNQQRVVRFSRSESGRISFDTASGGLIVTLDHAQTATPDPKARDPEDFSLPMATPSMDRLDLFFSLERYFSEAGGRHKAQWMTYGELQVARRRIADIESGRVALGPADAALVEPPLGPKELARAAMKLAFTVQDKISIAIAVFAFALIGVPLGIKVSRRETSANLAVAVVLALGYYFLTVMISWLDEHPEYRPDLLVWAPNLILIGLGLWLFRRLDKTA
jgi:lipopolysaccharide export system permease protein